MSVYTTMCVCLSVCVCVCVCVQVGNIAFDATAAELETLFKAHAPTQVRLHTDAKTGKPKGFAHVHFADAASLAR